MCCVAALISVCICMFVDMYVLCLSMFTSVGVLRSVFVCLFCISVMGVGVFCFVVVY